MHEPPTNLDPARVIATLKRDYGIVVRELEFLPLGHDSAAWVYAAHSDDTPRFVKVRLAINNPLSLIVPRYLRDQGVAVAAPIATSSGRLWAECDSYALIVYPFIAGSSAMQQGMSAAQWQEYGAILRRIHDLTLPSEIARDLRRETFRAAGVAQIHAVEAALADRTSDDPLAEQLARFWQARQALIHRLLARTESLGAQLAAAAPPLLLCHADIHTNNLLIDPGGAIWVVDWDEVMLAPRERDLMFIIGGISAQFIDPQQEAWCRMGYGAAPIDPQALAYYRYAWAVNDIGDFAAQVLLRRDLGLDTRAASLKACIGLFEPGEIVAIAQHSLEP